MNNKMTSCKVCNTQIAKNAKSCPSCGSVIKKPFYKKWWVWGIVIIITIIALSSGGNEGESAPVSTDVESTSAPTSVTESKPSEVSEKYLWIAENDDPAFTIQEKSLAFMKEHPEYFPGAENIKGAISDFVDTELTYAHLSKNIAKYGDKLIEIYGGVVDITESDDGTVTYLHVADYEGKNYILYYLGALENVFEDNMVSAYALPLDMTTFENMAGAYTEAVVCAACYVSSDTAE